MGTEPEPWNGTERRGGNERRSNENRKAKYFRIALTAWIIIFTLAVMYAVHQGYSNSQENKEQIADLQETKASNADLRRQINSISKKGCLAGRITVQKYNDLVQSIIDARTGQLNLALENNDAQAAAVHREAIARYKKDFVPERPISDCNKPVVTQITQNERPR